MKPMFVMVVAFVLLFLSVPSNAKQVVVTPEETHEILANPGMGWETFQRATRSLGTISVT